MTWVPDAGAAVTLDRSAVIDQELVRVRAAFVDERY